MQVETGFEGCPWFSTRKYILSDDADRDLNAAY